MWNIKSVQKKEQRSTGILNKPIEWSSAYRPGAEQWLCKQRPLLGNAHNIHARNNRMGYATRF
jgi:hypothetical protein